MSPNNKQNLSKDLENEIQNANLNQFAGQHFSSEEDDDRVITNGYMLLSHDLEQANGEDDSSSDFESDSSDEEIPADQLNQMVRCSVNVDFQEEPQNDEEEDRPEDAGRELENDRSASSRFRSYLDGQLQDVPFEREFDKHETNTEQQNTISLDKENIDQIKECMKQISLPSSSIPKWAKLSDSELTNFIHKKLEQTKR